MIVQKLPLLTLRTPLAEIPKLWLRHIEPKIMRGGFLPCWIWQGGLDKNGQPNVWYEGTVHAGPRWVMGIFFDFERSDWCHHLCTRLSCLNPGHYVISPVHPRNFDKSEYRDQVLR